LQQPILSHNGKLRGHIGAIYKLIDLPQSDHFISVGGDGYVVLWHKNGISDGKLIANADEQIFSACYLAEQHLLLLGGMSGQLHFLDLKKNTIVKKVAFHKKSIYNIASHHNQIYTASGDGILTQWSIENMNPTVSLQLNNEGLRSLCSHNKMLLVGGMDGQLFVIDHVDMRLVQSCHAHENSIFSILSTGDPIYTGSRDAHMKRWRLEPDIIEEISIPAHWFTVNDVILVEDFLVSASRDKKIRVWTPDLELLQSVDVQGEGHTHSVNSLLYIEDYGVVFSGGDDRVINVWKIIN
jgi:WD40 repeat protein